MTEPFSKILQIDDDVRDALQPYTRKLRESFHLLYADNVEDGLHLAREHAGEIRFVIWDMMMAPGADYENAAHGEGTLTGTLLFNDLRAILGPDVPMLLFTNHPDASLVSRFEGPGQNSYARRKIELLPSGLVRLVSDIVSSRLKGGDTDHGRHSS